MNKFLLLSVVIVGLLLTSCKKDKIEEEHDHEAVGYVELHFSKKGADERFVKQWKDLDGDGGNAPEVDVVDLDANSAYDVEIILRSLDGDDLSHEINDHESDAHRFYYSVLGGLNLDINELNKDDNNITLGSSGVWTAGAASTGDINIVLRHYGSAGKTESDAVNSPKSSTDLDISFPVVIRP